MKSIKFSFLEKFLVISILISFALSISVNTKPSTSITYKTVDYKHNKIDKIKLNDRRRSSSLSKNKNSTDDDGSSNSTDTSDDNTDTNSTDNDNNTKPNPPSPQPQPDPKPTPPKPKPAEGEVYYTPQIGGIKINNPLPKDIGVIGCKKCSPQEMAASKARSRPEERGISFREEPGVKFQNVGYVKELSPGGKKALEIEQMNEYLIFI
jgi:hypothetical protein